MTTDIAFNRYLARYPYVAAAAYVVLVLRFSRRSGVRSRAFFEQRAVLANSIDILDQLEAASRTRTMRTVLPARFRPVRPFSAAKP